MKEVVIVSAVRTATGSFMGLLSDIPAIKLGSIVMKEALHRANVKPEEVEDVIFGNVLQAGLGQGTARQAAIQAGIPEYVPATTINKLCGSGLKSVHLAAQAIQIGDADIVVAGGMENMSQAPYLLEKGRQGFRMGDGKVIDSMIRDGLICAINDVHMGITAENIADKYQISRKEQDKFAAWSQQKTEKAIEQGAFSDEIVPVKIRKSKSEEFIFNKDEFPRSGVTVEKLANLRPAFKKDGTVTAGNSSGINDGAAALVLMSKEKANALNIKPMATLRGNANAGVDSNFMGIGPVPATNKALKKANISIQEIGLIEANEAFASQALAVQKELNINPDILNIHGGAISLGHPIGASGARILVTLLHAMKMQSTQFGLATLCIGGGMGAASIVELEK